MVCALIMNYLTGKSLGTMARRKKTKQTGIPFSLMVQVRKVITYFVTITQSVIFLLNYAVMHLRFLSKIGKTRAISTS
jgi:hypothetical protein